MPEQTPGSSSMLYIQREYKLEELLDRHCNIPSLQIIPVEIPPLPLLHTHSQR